MTKNDELNQLAVEGLVPGQAIVQCPQCQTKFAVSEDSLGGASALKFHCSRCDHLFGLKREELKICQDENSSANENSGEDQLKTHVPTPVEEDMGLSGDIEVVMPPAKDVEEPLVSVTIPRDSPEVTVDPEQLSLSLGSSNTKREELWDQKEVGESDRLQDLQSELVDSLSPSQVAKRSVTDFQLLSNPKQGLNSSLGGLVDQLAPLRDDADRLENFAEQQSFEDAIAHQARAKKTSSWGGFFSLMVPIFLTLGMIAIVASFAEFSPRHATQLFSAVFPDLPRPAPSSLYVNQTRLKLVTLDSGELIAVVRGSITNRSQENYRDVVVEGSLFDSRGNLLSKVKVPAANSLTKSTLKSLGVSVLEELQQSPTKTIGTIRPGQSSDFSLAVTSGSIRSAKYYLVRVYAAKLS